LKKLLLHCVYFQCVVHCVFYLTIVCIEVDVFSLIQFIDFYGRYCIYDGNDTYFLWSVLSTMGERISSRLEALRCLLASLRAPSFSWRGKVDSKRMSALVWLPTRIPTYHQEANYHPISHHHTQRKIKEKKHTIVIQAQDKNIQPTNPDAN